MDIGSTLASSPSSTFLPLPDAHAASSKQALWNSLDVFQRGLLSTDGTLTLLLSAFLYEEISLTNLEQSTVTTAAANKFLEVTPGDKVLQRRVILSTAKSCRKLVYCESEIAIDRLDHEVKRRLLDDAESIGRILRSVEAETFRKLVDWGLHTVSKNEEIFKHFGDQTMLYRTYVIVTKKKPSMVITEYFSHHLFGTDFLKKYHDESAQ